jgi:hypothetical protein
MLPHALGRERWRAQSTAAGMAGACWGHAGQQVRYQRQRQTGGIRGQATPGTTIAGLTGCHDHCQHAQGSALWVQSPSSKSPLATVSLNALPAKPRGRCDDGWLAQNQPYCTHTELCSVHADKIATRTPLCMNRRTCRRRTATCASAPAVNAGAFFSAMSNSSPVLGLRPLRAARVLCSKMPKPGMATRWPARRRHVASRQLQAVPAAGQMLRGKFKAAPLAVRHVLNCQRTASRKASCFRD